MKFEKVGKEIKPGFYKSTFRSAPIEGDDIKMKNRYKIEQVVSDETYDIYDMFADLANAFNEYKSGNVNGPANQKWDERQAQIKTILG